MRAVCVLAGLLAISLACSPTMPPNASGAEVAVHVRSDQPGATLQVFDRTALGRHGRFDVYRTLCTAPCDLTVHDWSKLRVNADYAPASSPFYLSPGSPITLHARPGSTLQQIIGFGLLWVGASEAWGTGLNAALVPDTRREMLVAAGSGAVAAVIGVVLFGTSATRVTFDRGSR